MPAAAPSRGGMPPDDSGDDSSDDESGDDTSEDEQGEPAAIKKRRCSSSKCTHEHGVENCGKIHPSDVKLKPTRAPKGNQKPNEFYKISGDPHENVRLWAKEMRASIESNNWSVADGRLQIYKNLTGAALKHLRSQHEETIQTAEDMIRCVLRRWDSEEMVGEAKRRFKIRKQGPKENYRTFLECLAIDRKKGWPKESKRSRDQAVFDRFIEGLQDKDLKEYLTIMVSAHFQSEDPSIEKLIELCSNKRYRFPLETEETTTLDPKESTDKREITEMNHDYSSNSPYGARRNNNNGRSNPRGYYNGPRCEQCNGNHPTEDCHAWRLRVIMEEEGEVTSEHLCQLDRETAGTTNNQFWKDKVKEKPPCFICKGLGHWKNECPLNKKNVNADQSLSQADRAEREAQAMRLEKEKLEFNKSLAEEYRKLKELLSQRQDQGNE